MKLPSVEFPVKLPNIIPLDRCEEGRPKFKTEVPFMVYINRKPFAIPAGVEFDYASVPRWLTNIFPPNHPNWQAASLLHDVAYQGELWPREFCDKLFLSAMTRTGVSWLKRHTMWLAVRIGGGFTFKKHTPESIKNLRDKLRVSDFTTKPLWKEW
jgi:hypothetical protein